MRLAAGRRPLLAPTDLNDFLACPQRVALNRAALDGAVPRPDDDPTLAVIARKGLAHEGRVLAAYEVERGAVTRIPDGDASYAALEGAVAETRAAMRRGDQVIYQAAFVHGGWTGRADFLVRTETPSALGAWSYDVADTKLALREKPAFLVQLCLYAQFVAALQERIPRVRALFGDGSSTEYDAARYLPYVTHAQRRFAAAFDALAAEAVPDRREACGGCAWSARCDDARRGADHLSLVAGIRRSQIAKLRAAGISTLTALARASEDAQPSAMASFPTLKRQASLQLRGRSEGPIVELLPLAPRDGFALLPPPDPHDVYFDMEGDPLYEAGRGLEYLFGWWRAGGAYEHAWGETREGERRAFQRFIDAVVELRRTHHGAHVYHYANYEKAALRRLAQEHATREDEVDDLLREGVLVDLYAVVKGAIVQSQDGYSIKKLETFYGFTRSADVRKGDQSIVAFEEYLAERSTALREDIIRYNEEDCVSTAALHRWLLGLRPADARWRGEDETPAPDERPESDAIAAARTLAGELLDGALPGSPKALAAHLLHYYRRDDKPAHWAWYERIERAIDFIHDDHEAIGGLELAPDVAPYKIGERDKNLVYVYRYPEQRTKLGTFKIADPHTKRTVDVVKLDEDAREVHIKRAATTLHPRALVPGRPLARKAQADALMRFGSAVRDGDAPARYGAAWDLLTRARPRIRGVADGAPIQPAHAPGDPVPPDALAERVLALDQSALVVQGPPGSGKTYGGARAIAALLRAGRRVGITSTAHKAIDNLLAAVEEAVAATGATFRGIKKCGDGDDAYASRRGFVTTTSANGAFDDYALVAGTPFLFARAELAPVDVLVIDEAGQVSLADAIAVATNAKSVVLLGDPQQLAHVSQGMHPDGAGVSVLEHVLDGAPTIAADRGIFLDVSFRMHPELCAFVSSLMYERRLQAAPSCAFQRIDAPWFSGAGTRFVAVPHDGDAAASEDEARAVVDIVRGLLGGTFTAGDGSQRPLTLDDVLVVAPYNAQVSLLRRRLRRAFDDRVRVGTVDKFQGQEAPVVIYSLAASSAEDAPRGIDFLFDERRFNVAVSRGRALAVVVGAPALLESICATVAQVRAVAGFCAFADRDAGAEAVV